MPSLSDGITLVEIDGSPTPAWAKGLPPHDPHDASQWTESIEIDAIHYEVSDPDERAALEAAEVERIQDILDAPQPSAGEAIWAQLMIEGSLPAVSGGAPVEPFEPTAEDWAEYHRVFDEIDRRQVSDVELSMLAAGLPIG